MRIETWSNMPRSRLVQMPPEPAMIARHVRRLRNRSRPAGAARRAVAARARARRHARLLPRACRTSRARGPRPRLRGTRPARARARTRIMGVTSPRPAPTPARLSGRCGRGASVRGRGVRSLYCSSVIEHVPPSRRAAFASEAGASGVAGSCRRPRARSRSSPTRCCRRTLAAGLAAPAILAAGADGDWEEISLLSRAGSSRCSARPARARLARSSRAGCRSAPWASDRSRPSRIDPV